MGPHVELPSLGRGRDAYAIIRESQSDGADAEAGPATPAPTSVRWKVTYAGAVMVVALIGAFGFAGVSRGEAKAVLLGKPTPQGAVTAGLSENFDADGRFIMPSFDTHKPFSSFLPGIGGEWGMPMWAFYVNRGQAMAAFGVANKDNPMQTFAPANVAYQATATTGFRTLLKIKRDGAKEIIDAQPFFEPGAAQRDMLIGMNEMEITEADKDTGVDTSILYFTVPGEEYPALLRRVTFTNTGDTAVEMEVVDGLAKLEPYGVTSSMIGAMGRTLEGWMNVYNCQDKPGACPLPFFRLSASTADSAQVQMITEGNFALAFWEGEEKLLPIIVDPVAVFEQDTSLRVAAGFTNIADMIARSEMKASKTPCAFSASKISIAPGSSKTLVSLYGHASSMEQLTRTIAPSALARGFVPAKYTAAVALPERLTAAVHSSTANPLFDGFSRQMMLDNLLRGGYPEFLGDANNPKVYHTFSRIHGDLERDYNNFQIDASYFSQGSGNYRDVNQNRRVDVLLFPQVRDFNIRQFLTLKQADGYNPLTVATASFVIDGGEARAAAVARETTTCAASADLLEGILRRPFRPGQVFTDVAKLGINLTLPSADFLNVVTAAASQVFQANYTHEGFWADHWTYDLDQIESFEVIYPDDVERAMWDAEELPFFMSSGTVQPRDFKYVEVTKGKVRQYNSVFDDPHKANQLNDRITHADGSFELATSDDSGLMDDAHTYVYTVSPISKLLLLCVTKFALLDPSGMGIEMDANKPGWNDAMNGLPALLGSGMPETCEVLRVVRWILKTVKVVQRPIAVPAELATLVATVSASLSVPTLTDFQYWDGVADAREKYREAVRLFFSGQEVSLDATVVIAFLEQVETKLEAAIAKSIALYSPDGVTMPTYFAHEVTDYEKTGYKSFVGQPFVHAKAFKTQVFPMFLEGAVRQLKTVAPGDVAAFVAIHDAVRAGPLYDAPIKQYKICESLKGQPFEMGRMMAFTPGWLENESIWLHMSFKYYLELLRAGLFEQYWTAMETGAPYNMDVETYGRSPLEAASFIVSSAYPDKKSWGAGFLARLSGSTAEFLSMWLLIMAGPRPFLLSSAGDLELALRPALPAELFKADGTVTFTFLGKIAVTYHNPSNIDTWTAVPRKIKLTQAGDTMPAFTISGANVPAPHAAAVRAMKYDAIDVYFE
ncbi:hypothetical protein M885DRAFT_462977 [Pelagophyceae sp. CCMP2097]|nr:hypothetical protein M885DRAFT_462977 [Pelagophyceae sp. CCMP2097]|mmetsp:Transcript_23824/g.81438  ORF Transcript_23824/g.81438 Transcript_23824/m.81438 type:complete len:1176 (-) Transcript_23824:84-3611(-)